MVFSALITDTSGNGGQFSSRKGVTVDRIILHHCASTSLSGVLHMMSSGSREVSANYVIGNGGEIVGVVPEEYRAWTSSAPAWDGRAVTFEIVNESREPDWVISSKAFESVARVLADLSTRYGIELSRTTVVTHQELYTKHGASYATACPGPYLQARVDGLIELAESYLAGTPEQAEDEDDDMWKPTVHLRVTNKGDLIEGTLAHPMIGLDLKPGEQRKEITKAGAANVYRGFKASGDAAVVAGWRAAYAPKGNESSPGAKDQKAYQNMQAAQTQMSVDLYGLNGKG